MFFLQNNQFCQIMVLTITSFPDSLPFATIFLAIHKKIDQFEIGKAWRLVVLKITGVKRLWSQKQPVLLINGFPIT